MKEMNFVTKGYNIVNWLQLKNACQMMLNANSNVSNTCFAA